MTGTAGDVGVRPQVAAIGGRFEDYFDAPVVGGGGGRQQWATVSAGGVGGEAGFCRIR